LLQNADPVLMTDPHPMLCWNTSQLVYSAVAHAPLIIRRMHASSALSHCSRGQDFLPFLLKNKQRVLVQLRKFFWYAASGAALYRIDDVLPKRRARLRAGA
jgi:hypothetical protein